MERFSKLAKIRNDNNRVIQDYMKDKCLEDSRMEFKWRTNMIDTRTTMKGKYPRGQNWCPYCRAGWVEQRKESPSHLLTCDAYADLRVGLDPEMVRKDRAKNLRAVVARREELEKIIKR